MHSNSVSAGSEIVEIDFSSKDSYFVGALLMKPSGNRDGNPGSRRNFSSGWGSIIVSLFLGRRHGRVLSEFFDVSDEIRVIDEHSAGRRTGAHNFIRFDKGQMAVNRGF
jgi:hypothetical protein